MHLSIDLEYKFMFYKKEIETMVNQEYLSIAKILDK